MWTGRAVGSIPFVEKTPMSVTETELRSGRNEDLKFVRLQLAPNYHRALRKIAADHETSMAVMVREVLMDYIDRHSKESR